MDILRAAQLQLILAKIEDEMKKPIDFEYYFKRLLVMGQGGIYLKGADGHIWIECDAEARVGFHDALKAGGIMLNNKIYGGILEAIDTFDEAIQRAGEKPLIEQYGDWLFYGDAGVDDSRIDETEKGRGGIY